ncbi:bifunctional 2-polyprenyl-6-hydroxyphenol methylase/3-demethylubiquinol 3-O-methyltransferase UbiG [Sporosarcina sp. P7]|uniref:class I SAM-dependent methyltransferase n=1 Tax=Sporosarcina sp. P7 TaxID=2048244 RepID=UPI000C16BA2E|nr:class I SAM-dependent methyltransferase [Sporosarcina sp. P7]PID25448.1 SAM-dependent methyltransferase [Sporosarcina sp. P7]
MVNWNERFKDKKYIYGTEPNVFLKDMQGNLSGEVLTIAEGEGRNAVFLARQGLHVTAWDNAESGLDKLKKLAAKQGVQVNTQLIDLAEAQWQQNQWDGIVNIFGHFPGEVRLKTLHGVKEAVKPGGYFIAEVYSQDQIPYQSGGPKELDFLYRPEDFLDAFSDWRIIHFFVGEVIRHEGDLHKGLSHVIQFVGQKP